MEHFTSSIDSNSVNSDTFASSADIVRSLAPDLPVAACRPHAVRRAGDWFVRNFAGDILYAVKANPSEWVLDALWQSGVRKFDVASIQECELIYNRFDGAVLAFMHPVKNRNAISRAYREFGCRIFSLDSMEELQKIREATDFADDLTLLIRISVSNNSSSISLDGKFGTAGEKAVALLQAARSVTREDLGICFHVGSQCMDPNAYVRAMDNVKSLIIQAGVTIDIIDVGGGFPLKYRDMNPAPLSQYMQVITQKFETMPVTENCELWCEPGRALVGDSTSIITRVELVKGDMIYLNDGAYGNLFDGTHVNWPYEITHHRLEENPREARQGQAVATPYGAPERSIERSEIGVSSNKCRFKIYGPTCDGIDELNSEYYLPTDIKEGDYIEFHMLGAYGIAMATKFNGFGTTIEHIANDDPQFSMFGAAVEHKNKDTIQRF